MFSKSCFLSSSLPCSKGYPIAGLSNNNPDQSQASQGRGVYVPSGSALPAVSVPQQQADVVHDRRLAQLDLDSRAPVFFDGMSGEAVVQVIVLGVSVEQGRLELALHHLSAVLHGGDVLLRD